MMKASYFTNLVTHPSIIIGLFSGIIGCKQANQPSFDQNVTDIKKIEFAFKPNILWLSVEDINCCLPAYGDSTIETPNINRLANEGIVFENAFTVLGVSAPSRSSIITGMYPSSIGTNYMRSFGERRLPDDLHTYIELFEKAGYYCTNNVKTDYNFAVPQAKTLWDDCSRTAHWKNRKPGEPFFAVFNEVLTHEHNIWANSEDMYSLPIDKVTPPPYYPDDSTVRVDMARNYMNIQKADFGIGLMLKQLEDAGLLDSTIIVFWSDNGGPLPRQKRELYDSGNKVPLVIRFPKKILAGTRSNEFVYLMDLGVTMLSLVGIEPPKNLQASAFAGRYTGASRKYVYGARDRMDADYDMSRSVRNNKFLYIRNYTPEHSALLRIKYRLDMGMMRKLIALNKQGKLNEAQAFWFQNTKPNEELYDVQADPHQVHNLANNPNNQTALQEMRTAHQQWVMETCDLGFMTEAMLYNYEKQNNIPIYQQVRSGKFYPIDKIIKVASLCLHGEKAASELVTSLSDSIPAIRYWAAKGLGCIKATNAQVDLKKLMNDTDESVRLAAAFSLYQLGDIKTATAQLKKSLVHENSLIRLLAANTCANMGKDARNLIPYLEHLTNDNERYTAEAAAMAIYTINQ